LFSLLFSSIYPHHGFLSSTCEQANVFPVLKLKVNPKFWSIQNFLSLVGDARKTPPFSGLLELWSTGQSHMEILSTRTWLPPVDSAGSTGFEDEVPERFKV
jgi:hypothetical protein